MALLVNSLGYLALRTPDLPASVRFACARLGPEST